MSDGGWRQSGSPPYWSRGDRIYWRYRRQGWVPGKPETVRPMTVVRDDAEGLVAWLAPLTPVLEPVLKDGGSLRSGEARTAFDAANRAQARTRWQGPGILKVAPTGAPWSAWRFSTESGEPDGWYVNLEDPHVRNDGSVVSQDHVLDVLVELDRTTLRKDEDELVEAVRQGRYTAEDAAQFERDAAAVEKVAADWGSPFCDGWETWRPDPSWPVPDLLGDARWDYDLIDA